MKIKIVQKTSPFFLVDPFYPALKDTVGRVVIGLLEVLAGAVAGFPHQVEIIVVGEVLTAGQALLFVRIEVDQPPFCYGCDGCFVQIFLQRLPAFVFRRPGGSQPFRGKAGFLELVPRVPVQGFCHDQVIILFHRDILL